LSLNRQYDAKSVEEHWTTQWVEDGLYATQDGTPKDQNEFVLDMFPYPSGTGLHVGHPMGYVGTDIYSRLRRMQGKNVLHPMGYDAFGLPAEQHAMKTGEHPSIAVATAITNFRKALQDLGLSYDWSREINTTDPEYYKWTQWIFARLYERGLAYMDNIEVNWCPNLGTVLANEEVIDGISERGGHPVERRAMKQWVLRITEYADRLLEDLDLVDWPENVKEMQRNWIGKSEGMEVSFIIDQEQVEVFTTRPETLYGVTYIVLSPEHPLVDKITKSEQQANVKQYRETAMNLSDRERMKKEKTGVFTGAYAIHPITQEKIPVWIGDYVLPHYGKSAVMAVPSADERDKEFASAYGLESRQIFEDSRSDKLATKLINSGLLDGMTPEEAQKEIVTYLEQHNLGKPSTQYKLRDWIFSRQRYWGEPFPVIHRDDGEIGVVDTSKNPVKLPELDDYNPTGTPEPMLEKAGEWINTPDGRRETNTMPQWAGSCWYYMRYIDPHNKESLADFEKLKEWLPVDLYVGGTEHAVLHLLYARFWHKVLFDAGIVPTKEPFQKLINQGMILSDDGEKMSKSKGNTVAVADVIQEHGADVFRVHEMFLGAFEKSKPWSTEGINGVKRWLEKVWNVLQKVDSDSELDEETTKQLHRSIKKVTEDIEKFKFNTAITQLMTLTNAVSKLDNVPMELAEILCKLIAPFSPMMAEEIWCNILENDYSVHKQSWPEYDKTLAALEVINVAVQVNGKVRAAIQIDADEVDNKEIILERARTSESVQKYLSGGKVIREIYVPGKVLNFVLSK